MATQPDDDDFDNVEIDDVEVETVGDEPDEGDNDESDDNDDGDDFDGVSFEDEDEPAQESKPMREMRKRLAEANKKLRERERNPAPQSEPDIVVGDRPKWNNGDDWEWDEARFEAAIDAYEERKTKAAEQQIRRDAAESERKADWGRVQANYLDHKSKLPFTDAQDMEDLAFGELSEVHQAVIGKYAKNPALLVYALGKSAAKLSAFASESDPIKLGQAIITLEANLKKEKRNTPAPEERVRGRSPRGVGSVDKKEQQLEKEAERTGNRTELLKYRREKAK